MRLLNDHVILIMKNSAMNSSWKNLNFNLMRWIALASITFTFMMDQYYHSLSVDTTTFTYVLEGKDGVQTVFYLLIRVGECAASHVAGVHSNRVLLSGTVIIKAQFKQRTLVVKSPRTEKYKHT